MKSKTKNKKIKSFIYTHHIKIILVLLFFAALFFRTYGLFENLFFGPEQGIDFMVIRDIVMNYNFVLVGAKTDIAGVFHGPIYYYLSVLPFFVSGGDPLFIAEFLIILNCFSVFIIYKLTTELFEKRTGLIASLLFALSFGAVSYSRWLSSHPLTIPLSCLFFLGIVMFMKGNKKYLFLTSIAYGLVGQAEFLNYLFFGVMLCLVLCIYRKNFLKEKLIFLLSNLVVVLFVAFSNYILFDIRNDFIMSKNILALVFSPGYHFTFQKAISITLHFFITSIGEIQLPERPFLGAILPLVGGILVFKSNKRLAKLLLSIWLFTPVFLLIILRHDILTQFFVYAVAPVIILCAYFMSRIIVWRKKTGVVLFGILLSLYVLVWVKNVPYDHYMFYQSTQPNLKYKDELDVIDNIYEQMNGKNFSFQSYTIPYWSQQAWEYLFWQYGGKKYGYEPVTSNGKVIFVIIQDDPSSKNFQSDWIRNTVSKWGVFESKFRYGILTVHRLSVPWIK